MGTWIEVAWVQEPEGIIQKVLQSRWIIPAKQHTEVEVVLQASALGLYRQGLNFEVSCTLLLAEIAKGWLVT